MVDEAGEKPAEKPHEPVHHEQKPEAKHEPATAHHEQRSKKRLDLKLSVPVIIIAILLLAITLYGFWVRDQPARFGELQGLDDFYLYRVSSYALDHGLSLPVPDYYRNYPFGTHPEFDQPLPFLMAPAFYLALGQPGHFLDFAIHWPAIGGAVSVFFLFFLVRELGKRVFRKRDSESGNGASALHLYTRWLPELAGLFAAFFAAVTPAFINRTGAGNYEKEGTAAFFLTLMLWLFARAYIKKDWRCGVAAGFALVGLVWSWGGSAYFFILFAAFTLLGLLLDLDVERFAAAYVPTILIGLLVPLLYPQHLDLLGPPALVSLLVVGLLAVRMGAQRFKLVKESQLKFIVAALFVIGMLAVTGLWYAGVEPVAGKVDGLLNILSLTPGVELSTVAESQPGGWGDVVARTAPDLANQALPWLAPVTGYFALWAFALLGLVMLLVQAAPEKRGIVGLVGLVLVAILLVALRAPATGSPIHIALAPAALLVIAFLGISWKTKEAWPLLPMLWYLSAVFGVFGFIRLLFLVGLPSAVLGGLLIAWFAGETYGLGKRLSTRMPKAYNFFLGKRLSTTLPVFVACVVVGVVIVLTVLINGAAGAVYGSLEGPSICFPGALNGQRCVTVNADGTQAFAPGQPWYQAFEFLATSTPPSGNVLSWWDFGYWFQTRGQRPSPTDGGFGIRDEVADWFLTDTANWSDWEPWLDGRYHVQTILMDYSLPGKFGAISKISLRDRVIGIPQFSQVSNFPQGNVTVFEYGAGDNRIWIPVRADGGIASSPQLLLSNGVQYVPQAYINDMCTSSGIVRVGNSQPEIPGCIANTPYGLFFVPGEVERSIFTSLMFMDGAGLPVTKTFDNTLVKIYQVNNATAGNVTIGYVAK